MPGNALLRWISDLFWPLSCLGCFRRDTRLCHSCASGIDAPTIRRRPFPAVDRLVAAGAMRGPLLARAVWHFKYRNAPDLAQPLGDVLASAAGSVGVLPARDSIVVPVPLHPRRLRERGYNQAELLARAFAAIALLPCLPGVVVRTRHTTSQVESQDRPSRFKNMEGAFACPEAGAVRGRSILLVDDVSTTGATLDACATALKAAGARSVTAVVLARG